MAQTIVFINDREVDYRSATVSVFDYTVHCGIGLFESVLGVDRRLILLNGFRAFCIERSIVIRPRSRK